ncbi:MAG: hypothetical protein N2484_15900 [Clostridia bacterium]|nr:hypothetical protein [Clostridia bacterium]
MRKIFSGPLLVFMTGGLLGMITGAVALNILVSYRLDRHHQEIKNLQNMLMEKEIKLSKLEESINKNKFVIKDIEIMIHHEADELDKIELEKAVRKKYSSLVGREVKSVDMDLAAEIIENRIMKVQQTEYQLKVRRIFLSEVLKIWIDASKVN